MQKRLREFDVDYSNLEWDKNVDFVIRKLKDNEPSEGLKFTKLISIIMEKDSIGDVGAEEKVIKYKIFESTNYVFDGPTMEGI